MESATNHSRHCAVSPKYRSSSRCTSPQCEIFNIAQLLLTAGRVNSNQNLVLRAGRAVCEEEMGDLRYWLGGGGAPPEMLAVSTFYGLMSFCCTRHRAG